MGHFPKKEYTALLANWIRFAQRLLYFDPQRPGYIIFGHGEHGHWGVHTHQKAMSAFGVAAQLPDVDWSAYGLTQQQVLDQALGLLRFTLNSHLSGDYVCADGEKWGHNWIYVLGMERMMHGVEAIEEHLTAEDKQALRRVWISECDWLLHEYPVQAGLVINNKPESNIWNGAALYRTAAMYPDAPNAQAYREKALVFFANGLSKESDAVSEDVYDGIPVKDLFVGANYFDSLACNHHGYMNVGYIAVCLSNIAILHFSFKHNGFPVHDIVYRHIKAVWEFVRTCTFDDGRLLRIGGDSRARYSYCQDFAMQVWPLAEDVLGIDCSEMEQRWLKILQTETAINGDGSFLSNRVGFYEEVSPVYYSRLESDRANVISMSLLWHSRFDIQADKKPTRIASWQDGYHGAVMTQGEKRHASFVWRSSEKPQGLCLPIADSSLAEWRYNLAGRITGVGATNDADILSHQEMRFDGGFLTHGSCMFFSDKFYAEGQLRENMALQQIAFAALPDDATVLCLQSAKAANRTYIASVRGILWNVPNDIFNERNRTLYSENLTRTLRGGDYAKHFETLQPGYWVNVDDKIGLSSLAPLTVVRNGRRQVEIKYRPNSGTLYTEEICAPYSEHKRWYDRGEPIYNAGFAIALGTRRDTQAQQTSLSTLCAGEHVPSVCVCGKNGRRYALLLNTGTEAATLSELGKWRNLVTGKPANNIVLAAGEAVLWYEEL